MQTTLQRVSLPDGKRILMISDVHGHADGLRSILREAHFSSNDVLIIVGDLIEKGPQSLDTLRLVMDLCRTHTVYPLMGNVDLWRLEYLQSGDPSVWQEMAANSLQAMEWWGGSLLHEMCWEMGVQLTKDTQMAPLIPPFQRRFAPEIEFLSHLPTLLETQRMIFVHGGLPHENLAALEGTNAYSLLKFDNFYTATDLSFSKYVVTGHTPAVLYSKTYPIFLPVIDRQRRIISLDGGCGVKAEGQLNLLAFDDWRSDDPAVYTWNHLPVIRALDAQAPSPAEKARYIRWTDHAVTLVDRDAEMARVLYHGAPMEVPGQFLFDHQGVLSCTDATDYVLPVAPGDELHLILALSRGCYVKKDSAAGWYFGRYEQMR